MKAYFIRGCVLLLITISGCGCATVEYNDDKYPYQPIIMPPNQVKGVLIRRPKGNGWIIGVTTYTNTVRWVNKYKTFDSDDMIWRADIYLKNNNLYSWWRYEQAAGLSDRDIAPKCQELCESDLPNDNRYPWLRYQNAFYLKRTPSTFKEEYEKSTWKEGHKVIKTIICLKPIIVVISEGSILNYYESRFIDFENNDVIPHWPGVDIRDADGIILKHGYAYGTRIPYSGKLEWFSPELNILPRPVEIDNNGIGHIKVKWGELVFTKIKDEWLVSAKATK